MAQAKRGDTVSVHYTGRLVDGSVFDTSNGGEPLEFTLGEERVIAGFERAVLGMAPGETRTAQIPSSEAYGPHQPELVVEFGRDQVPPELELEVGQTLHLSTQDGQTVVARVIGLTPESVTLDANHPLAGKDLTFSIELVQIAPGQ